MGRKKIYLVWGILVILIMLAGSYAYFSWRTSESRLVLTVGNINNIQVTLKPYRIDTDILPVLTYENEDYVSVDVVNSNNKRNTFELYYKINTIDEELKNSNFKYTITKSTDGGNTYSEVKTDTFSSANDGTEITIYSSIISGIKTEKYKVYVWLDGSDEGQTNVVGKTFNAELRALFIPADDIVVDVPTGLIPVVFDTADDTVVKTISQDDLDWYDYSSQEWANAVLVKESGTQTRAYYKANTGVEINKDDILAYYTYVPRYKYKIWTTELSATGNEQTIDIVFESANVKKSTGTTVGSYITHPAFTFGDIELNGIWVGKFETTGIADEPTVLPDVSSLRNQNVSTQFQTALKFSGGSLLESGNVSISGNSTYGLTTNANSHMMKNSEWGAVAYLSHSKYGVDREVYINNSSSYYTGRSGGNVGGSTPTNEIYTNQSATDQYNEYGFYTWDGYLLNYNTNTKSSTRDLSKVASTTGNITGIYDMSGGAWEYVMGYYSGASTTWGATSDSNYAGFSNKIDNKYYDNYTTTNLLTACSGGVCYGHRLSETNNWYGDNALFITASNPWLYISCRYSDGIAAGLFVDDTYSGVASNNGTFRSVIVYDPTGKIITAPTVTIGTNGNSGYISGSISSTISVSKGSAELDASSLKYIYSTSSTDTPNTSFTSGNTYTLEGATGTYYLIARACDVDGECTKVVSKPFYVDNTAPVITLSKETYQEGFDGWTLPTGGSVSNNILTLSQSGQAYSGYYAVNGEYWYVTYDAYTETASTSHDSATGDAGKGDGGIFAGTEYFDASKASVKSQNGSTGNGNAPQLPLNTWSNNIKWNGYSGYGTDVKYLRFRFTTGNSYSQPPIKIRNFKLWGQMYSNSFYNINISKSDNNEIKTTKYASGNQTASYFASNGTVVTDNVIRVTDNNTYTVYVEDLVGNKNVSTITIDKIDKMAPTGTISASFSSGTLKGTVSASDNLSGVSSYMYALTTSTTCPTSGYTESTNNSYSFTLSSVGTYYICTKIKDVAGNTSSAIRSSAYKYTAPTITLGTNGNSAYVKGNVSSKITVTKGSADLSTSTYKYIFSTSNSATPSTSFTSGSSYTLTSGNGKYYLIAKACDIYSKCTTIVSKPFYVDNTAPTGTVAIALSSGKLVGTVSASDNLSGVSSYMYALTTSSTCPTSGYTESTSKTHSFSVSSAGTYYICTKIKDVAGNTSSAIRSSAYKYTAPTITLGTNGNSAYVKGNVSSKITVTKGSADLSTSTYKYIFSTSNSATPSTSFTSGSSYTLTSGNGKYYLIAKACDIYSKCTTVASKPFYVDNTAPTGTISASFSSGKLVGTVSASDNLSGISSYYYALSTSSTCPTSGYTESTSKTHSFSVSGAGTYYICTKIKDVAGNTSNAIRSSGYSNSSTVRINGVPGETITYTGASSGSITIGSTGYSTVTLLNGTYKFTSNIAKSTSSTTTDYSQSVTVSSNNQTINFYPSGAVYWFGNGVSDTSLYNKTGGITGNYIQTNSFYAYYYAYSTSVHGDIATIKKISLLNSSGTKYSKLKIMYETNEESKDYWCWNGSCYQKTNHLKIYDYSSGTELLNQMVSSVNTKSIYTVDLTSSTYSSISNIKFNAEVYAGNGYRIKLTIYAIWLE